MLSLPTPTANGSESNSGDGALAELILDLFEGRGPAHVI